MLARRIIKWFFIVIAVLILAVLLLPWKPIAEKKLLSMLAEKGISPAHLSIDHIGVHGLVLKDVTLGDPPLKLSTLTLAYQPRALLEGRIEEVVLTGLSIRAAQGEDGWNVEGLTNVLRSKTSKEAAAIPVTNEALAALPLNKISLQDSTLTLSGKALQADIPLKLMLQQKPTASIALESKAASVISGDHGVAIGRIVVDLALDETKPQWNGTWTMENIAVTSEALTVPPLAASGMLTIVADKVELTGSVQSADTSVKAEFSLSYALNDPTKSYALLKHLRMPFNGGVLATKDVKIILDGKKRPLHFTLALSNIAVDMLIQTLTSNRATASGIVSGNVPVTITADGQVRVGKSVLKAEGPGMIALAPEVIPGDNPQVALVREVMKNLQYQVLALEFGMGADNMLTAKLAVEGRNPDVEGGRPIKLNVNLSGDLLDLILQNVRLMTDPKTFIEQKNHETQP